MEIIKCQDCGSEIAVENGKSYDIDCDCGAIVKGISKEVTGNSSQS